MTREEKKATVEYFQKQISSLEWMIESKTRLLNELKSNLRKLEYTQTA